MKWGIHQNESGQYEVRQSGRNSEDQRAFDNMLGHKHDASAEERAEVAEAHKGVLVDEYDTRLEAASKVRELQDTL